MLCYAILSIYQDKSNPEEAKRAAVDQEALSQIAKLRDEAINKSDEKVEPLTIKLLSTSTLECFPNQTCYVGRYILLLQVVVAGQIYDLVDNYIRELEVTISKFEDQLRTTGEWEDVSYNTPALKKQKTSGKVKDMTLSLPILRVPVPYLKVRVYLPS